MVELLTRDIMPGLTFIFETGSLVAQAYLRTWTTDPCLHLQSASNYSQQPVFSLFANWLFVPEPHFCF